MSKVLRRLYAFKAEKPSAIKRLVYPIGQPEKPLIGENSGVDDRTWKQKKDDFLDMQKNRQRREELKAEFRQSTFQPIYQFRDTGGKFFTSPPEPWNANKARYMPNFVGLTLDKAETSSTTYLGSGLSVVRLFSTTVGQKQVATYTEGLDFEKAGISLLDLNTPTSWVNLKLVQFFSGSIRRSLLGPFHNYLICYKGVSPELRSSIWAANELGGYLYVVDKHLKIRWAASGEATEADRKLFKDVLKQLV